MARIDGAMFGSIIVDGKKYGHDVVVSWDGEVHERQSSHNLTRSEMTDALMKGPDVIVVGTGTAGLMQVDPSAEVAAKLNGVELIAKDTSKAIGEFNKLARTKKVVAIIHVTC